MAAQTESDARQAAERFLQQRTGQPARLTSARLTTAIPQHKARAAGDENANVYAFNADGGGFALVLTGGGRTVVAGYSDKGSVDATQLPDAMKAWLAEYGEAMAATATTATTDATNTEVTDAAWVGPTVTPVAPLISTKWGQGAPFNSQCPGIGTKRTAVGCVPVALAQVLNYYHQDRVGGGTLEYSHTDSETEYTINYATTTYDWANMLDTYDGTCTKAQTDAVGKLMLECGIACKATFGYGSTSAQMPYVALNRYYNYDCMLVERERSATESDRIPTATWMRLIQDELTAGRPIIYSGTDKKPGADIIVNPISSHCFVIDGIDDKNYVHVNWGWSGEADGWFDVAILNPGNREFYYNQGYRCQHSMLIGIKPRPGAVQAEVCQTFPAYICQSGGNGWVVKSQPSADVQAVQPLAISSGKANRYYFRLVGNTYDEESKFTFVLVKNGNVVADFNNGGIYKVAFGGSVQENSYANSFKNVPAVADGTYQLRVAYKENGQLTLCPMPEVLATQVQVQGNGGEMVFSNIVGDLIADTLVIEDIAPAGKVYANTRFYLNIQGHGTSNTASLQFRNMETDKVYGASSVATSESGATFSFLYPDYTQRRIFRFWPKRLDNGFTMPAGRYKVELAPRTAYVNTHVALARDFYLDVEEKPDVPLLMGSPRCGLKARYNRDYGYDYCVWDWAACGLEYAGKVEDPVDLRLYMVNYDTGEETILTQVYNWTPGQSVDLNLTTYPMVGNYYFTYRYSPTSDHSREYETITPLEYYLQQKEYQEEPRDSFMVYHFVSNPQFDIANNGDWCRVTGVKHWPMTGASEPNTVRVNLMVCPAGRGSYGDDAAVTLIVINKTTGNVRFDTYDKLEVPAGEETTVPLMLTIVPGEEYEITALYCSDTDTSHPTNTFMLNADNSIFRLSFDKNGQTSIADATTAPSATFREGETVSVYTLDGRLLHQAVYGPSFWAGLDATLPHGTFVLKSASHTMKLTM